MDNILDVNDLQVSFNTYAGEVKSVRGVSFRVKKGETLAIVGESGSGKTVTAKSILRLIKGPIGKIKDTSEINFQGENILAYKGKKLASYRGGDVSMIFQDAMTSLNPTMKVGDQIIESIRLHEKVSKKDARNRAIEMLRLVKITNPELRVDEYPYQLSGGMRQRVMIAIALSCNPKILIADEPTTALDVTVQAEIMDLLKSLQNELGIGILLITHDLGVVAENADRVMVMYGGTVVEEATVEEIFYNPQHLYTASLLRAIPKLSMDRKVKLTSIAGSPPDMLEPPKGCPFAPRCEKAMNICKRRMPKEFIISNTHKTKCWLKHDSAPRVAIKEFIEESKKVNVGDKFESDEKILEVKNLKKYFQVGKNKTLKAVDDVSFYINKGETLGIVGESGCGKTTCGRTLVNLYTPSEGSVYYRGQSISDMNSRQLMDFNKDVQMIFQDPYASLNPRMTVADIIAEGLDIHNIESGKKRQERIYELLNMVGLNKSHANRFPHEFSGGQRQRIGIARALSVNPKLIVCDEPISALDMSIQAQVINLLLDLQTKIGLTYVFIAHDLSMVKYISDRVAVMHLGRIVELADSDSIYQNPYHPYTKMLMESIPIPDPKNIKDANEGFNSDEAESPINPKAGCRFAKRCKYAMEICRSTTPKLKEIEKNHYVSCHMSF
jgi:peptide/nickel transport system ATP-binding protein